MPAEFLLIRHAESQWNAEGRWQGQADPPLSERGREQARTLAAALEPQPIAALLCSDLARARETAEIVGVQLGLRPDPDPRLRELDVGEWSGLTRPEIVDQAPETLERFEAGEPGVRPGGGESRREIRRRVRSAMQEIAARFDGKRVAVVTHLGVIRALRPGTELANAECVVARSDTLAKPDDADAR